VGLDSGSEKQTEQGNEILGSEKKVKELVFQEEKVEKFKFNIAVNYYNLGEVLKEIKDKRLYLLKSAFFDEYCLKHLGFTRQYAYTLIRIREEFDVKTSLQWNFTKLEVLLPLKEEDRREILETHSPDVSVKELREKVRVYKDPLRVESVVDDDIEYFKDTEALAKSVVEDLDGLLVCLDSCKMREAFKGYDKSRLRSLLVQVGEKSRLQC